MARILFYLVILAAGAAIAWVVADLVVGLGGHEPGDVALEGPYALRHRAGSGGDCDFGPQFLGLPVRELAVGVVTTLFGIVMQSVGGSMIRRG